MTTAATKAIEEKAIEEKTIEESKTETTKKEEFTSFCGFSFDPATNSDCYMVCKKDELPEFEKCLAHFQTLEVKPKAPTAKGGRGKSFWGHINGTQAGLIDDCLVNAEKPVSLTEIATCAGGKPPRVLHHLKHLVKNKGAAVELTKDNCIYWVNNPNILGLKSHGSVTGLFLRKTKPVEKPKEDKALKDAEKAIKEEEKKEGIVTKDAFAKLKVKPAAKKPAAKKPAAKKEKK